MKSIDRAGLLACFALQQQRIFRVPMLHFAEAETEYTAMGIIGEGGSYHVNYKQTMHLPLHVIQYRGSVKNFNSCHQELYKKKRG